MNKEIKLIHDSTGNTITLEIAPDKNIKIDVSGDIDLTDFIKELTYLIPQKEKLTLKTIDLENQKIKLIQDTIDNIINSFNECLEETDNKIFNFD